MGLEWPDEYQEARFFTSVAKVSLPPSSVGVWRLKIIQQTISKAVESYCATMEDLFMEDMYPQRTEQVQSQKQSAWLEKAKQTIQGEKKVEPFNFTPQVISISVSGE